MQTTIHHSEVQVGEIVTVELTNYMQILHFGAKSDRKLKVWYKTQVADEGEDQPLKRKYRFVVLGTGWIFPKDLTLDHVATSIVEDYVWHLFQVRD